VAPVTNGGQTLRQKLIEAGLVDVEDDFDPQMLTSRTNEDAANVALGVFAGWLRAESEALRDLAEGPSESMSMLMRDRLRFSAAQVSALADAAMSAAPRRVGRQLPHLPS
jgi:hypothetical protein